MTTTILTSQDMDLWHVNVVVGGKRPDFIIDLSASIDNTYSSPSEAYRKIIREMGKMIEALLPEYMNDEIVGTALDSGTVYHIEC